MARLGGRSPLVSRTSPPYYEGMRVLAGVIWHYWIGVALMIPAVLLVLGIAIGYLVKVVAPRYPRR